MSVEISGMVIVFVIVFFVCKYTQKSWDDGPSHAELWAKIREKS